MSQDVWEEHLHLTLLERTWINVIWEYLELPCQFYPPASSASSPGQHMITVEYPQKSIM